MIEILKEELIAINSEKSPQFISSLIRFCKYLFFLSWITPTFTINIFLSFIEFLPLSFSHSHLQILLAFFSVMCFFGFFFDSLSKTILCSFQNGFEIHIDTRLFTKLFYYLTSVTYWFSLFYANIQNLPLHFFGIKIYSNHSREIQLLTECVFIILLVHQVVLTLIPLEEFLKLFSFYTLYLKKTREDKNN